MSLAAPIHYLNTECGVEGVVARTHVQPQRRTGSRVEGMRVKVVEYEVGGESVVAGTRTQSQRVVEGAAEGMPVRVRVMSVSEAGSSVPIPPAATVAPGGFIFRTPLQNLLTQSDSCPGLAGIRSCGTHGCVGGRSSCGPFVPFGLSRSR